MKQCESKEKVGAAASDLYRHPMFNSNVATKRSTGRQITAVDNANADYSRVGVVRGFNDLNHQQMSSNGTAAMDQPSPCLHYNSLAGSITLESDLEQP